MWEKQYRQLAEYTVQLEQKFREMELLFYRIRMHVDETVREDLHLRNKVRFMRLKHDVTLATEYVDGPRDKKLYPAGTLIDCGPSGHVYLDDDGDGNLYFPINFLEPVELNWDQVPTENVVYQG